jgi:hypothetical protein
MIFHVVHQFDFTMHLQFYTIINYKSSLFRFSYSVDAAVSISRKIALFGLRIEFGACRTFHMISDSISAFVEVGAALRIREVTITWTLEAA